MSDNLDRELYQESLQTVQEAAKQLVTVTPILQSIYFAAISISDLKKSVSGSVTLAISFVVPVLIWVACLAFALQVFMPPLVRETDLDPQTYKLAAQKAYRNMQVARALLLAGLVWMAANIVFYFALLPPQPAQNMRTPCSP